MRVLITGGAGCLGANMIDHLLPREDVQTLVIDNFATGHRASLPDGHPRLEIVEGSIVDNALVEQVFDHFKPTHVLHAAAAYKDPDDWEEDAASNVTGSIHVARAAEKAKVKRLVNFQTALTFGRPDRVPIPNDAPSRPFTSYGISKTAGEQIMLMADLNVVSLRLGNVTGPRLAIGPIPTFYKRLKEGKSCFCSDTVRDFLDMSDFIALLDKVMDENASQGVFNVSTGEGKSIKDVFDAVVDYLGIELAEEPPIVPPGDDDVPAVVLDPSRTEEAFGWKAKVGFKDTIDNMLDWYDKHGITAVYAHLKAPKLDK